MQQLDIRHWEPLRSLVPNSDFKAYKSMQSKSANPDSPQSRRVFEMGNGTLEIFDLPISEPVLFELLRDIFENYWQEIVFGILIQGAAWEIKASTKPESVTLYDGYLTVDFGAWHFHICIGENKGSPSRPTDPVLKAHRRTSRAELYRQLSETGTPNSWGLRLYNGKDEQQLTVFLPNPFLTPEMQIAKRPDWSRLALWDHLRNRWLGLSEPDPFDRTGLKFQHG